MPRSSLVAAILLLLVAACGSTSPDPSRPLVTTVAPQVAEPSAQVLAALADNIVAADELEAA